MHKNRVVCSGTWVKGGWLGAALMTQVALGCGAEPAELPEAVGVTSQAVVGPPIQLFGSGELTQARAEQIVDDAGFTYLDHAPCPGNAHHCAIFTVRGQGAAARLFAFQVLDEACEEPIVPFHPDGTPPGNAKRCFGSYTTLTRSVVTPVLEAYPDIAQYGAGVEIELQVINDNREWEMRQRISAGRVQRPIWTHGVWVGDEEIEYYEARNRLGLLVDSEYESTVTVPSSEALTDEEKCAVLGQAFEDYAALFEDNCPLPDLAVEPFGVGVTIETCNVLSSIATNFSWATNGAFEAACNAAPDCILRGECQYAGFVTLSQEAIVDVLVEDFLMVDRFFYEGESCPETHEQTRTIGDGCTETTKATCEATQEGCLCTVQESEIKCP